VSDISIADFWGIHTTNPELVNNNKGVSAVLVNTVKGYSMLDKVRSKNVMIKSVTLESIQKNNTPLSINTVAYSKREQLFKDYYLRGLAYCFKKYGFPSFPVRALRKILRLIHRVS